LIDRQVVKLRDQVTLLDAVVRDIEQTTHAAPAV
jgi:hypothetical protein